MKHTCAVATAMVLLLAGASASAQSLADVARQEQERRKSIATPSRVYTEADVDKSAPLTTAAARPQASSSAAAQPGEGEPGDGKSADGKAAGAATDGKPKEPALPTDEAGWRGRLDQARADLARSQRLLSAMEQQLVTIGIQTATAKLAGQQPDQSRQQDVTKEVERLRADVQKFTEAISKVESDARSNNVPPGWIR